MNSRYEKPIGYFAKSYPYNCKKSERILKEMYDYWVKTQRKDGTWTKSRQRSSYHSNTYPCLALLASGYKEYLPNVKRYIKTLRKLAEDNVKSAYTKVAHTLRR